MGRTTPLAYGRAHTVCAIPYCEHAVARHGDHWAHCEKNMDPVTLVGRVELSPEFLDGPESNCTAGRWKDKPPINVPALAADRLEESLAKAAEDAVALLKAFGSTIPTKDEDIRAGLTALAADGHLSAEIAARVETTLIAEKEAALGD